MKSKLLWISLAGTVICMFVLRFIDVEISLGDNNFGIVSFELAKSIDNAGAIINYWKSNSVFELAIFSIGFDYLYILFYVGFLAFLSSVQAERFYSNFWKQFTKFIIVITVFAGLFDMAENYFMMQFVFNETNSLAPLLAFWFAGLKFSLLAIVILYNIIIFLVRRFVCASIT